MNILLEVLKIVSLGEALFRSFFIFYSWSMDTLLIRRDSNGIY
jgi:hypothetical protein